MACHPCPLAHLVSWWWFLGWTSWTVRGPRGWRLTHAGGTMSPASTQSPGRSPVLCRQLWSSGPLLEHRRETWESYGASVRFPSVENGIQASSLSLSHTHTHARTHACTHACMHARTHAHTHTHNVQVCSTPSGRSVFSVAFETVPMLNWPSGPLLEYWEKWEYGAWVQLKMVSKHSNKKLKKLIGAPPSFVKALFSVAFKTVPKLNCQPQPYFIL